VGLGDIAIGNRDRRDQKPGLPVGLKDDLAARRMLNDVVEPGWA
jgi:hypothetical protein